VKHVAIDLGGRESQICVRGPSNQILEELRLGTRKLADFFDTLEKPSRIILETTAEAFAVADLARARGHDVRVVAATLVPALGVGQRGIKTDVRDARCLSEASVRMDLGSVHIPSTFAREIKAVCTLRATLVRSRTGLINSVRGWLRGNLLRIPGGAAETLPQRVRTHLADREIVIPPAIERQLEVITSMNAQILAGDDELKELAKNDPDAKRLMTIPGVGPTVAVTFLAAVDSIDRFKNPHGLESYFGLTPGEHSSSDSKHRTGLTKAGSTAVRSLMVQAAWSAVRSRPNDPMVLWAANIIRRNNKKNVAVVALARKMVGIMFALLRDKTNYQPLRGADARPEPTTTVTITEAVEVLRLAKEQSSDVDTTPSSPRATRAPRSRSKDRSEPTTRPTEPQAALAVTKDTVATTPKRVRPRPQTDVEPTAKVRRTRTTTMAE